ncbi:MAG: TolC family protein [Nitrospirae bacterium]|nr:TolC family protein [Nitrospirota bacterium]
MANSKSFFIAFFCAMILISFSRASAQEKIVMDLKQCIDKAVDLSPEIGEARYEVQASESKKAQADAARYPQVEFLALTAPSPRARGDQVSSPDDSTRPVISGIFGKGEVSLIQPLYTFGKISSFREASESGIKVSMAGVDKKVSDIVLRIKYLYYSLLLAKDLKRLILEIKDDLVTTIEKVEKQLDLGSPWVDQIDQFKLNAFLGEVDRNLNEAEKSIALAKDALKTSIGIAKNIEFDIIDNTLTREERPIRVLEDYINDSRQLRPEFIQLREGLKAREALVSAEKSNYYPMLFLGARGSLAGASNRDRLHNPFVFDEFNHSYGAVFLGLKWSIDFGITKGKVREADAEHRKLLEKKRFADEGIPFEVRKAYLDIEEASKSIEATEKAYKNARKWIIAAVANFDMGVGEAKEIADAVSVYALTRANNLRSIYNERMSYANLLYATGRDKTEK